MMSTSKNMTIRNLDDVGRFLSDLLTRTIERKDYVDAKHLAKCVAVVSEFAMLGGDIRDAVRQSEERLAESLDLVRAEYGE